MQLASEYLKPLSKLKGKLIVSCQASLGEPLHATEHIVALSLSCLNGGAGGLRLEGAQNIQALRSKTNVPIIGLTKSNLDKAACLMSVYITPTFEDARLIAEAGSDVIALDATSRARPDKSTLEELVKRIQSELHKPVWADVSSFEEGIKAAAAGANIVSTTLSGYTQETYNPNNVGPDLELLEKLCNSLSVPVVLEGKVWEPQQVAKAFDIGAFAVVVGSAITRPQLITERFVKAIP